MIIFIQPLPGGAGQAGRGKIKLVAINLVIILMTEEVMGIAGKMKVAIPGGRKKLLKSLKTVSWIEQSSTQLTHQHPGNVGFYSG